MLIIVVMPTATQRQANSSEALWPSPRGKHWKQQPFLSFQPEWIGEVFLFCTPYSKLCIECIWMLCCQDGKLELVEASTWQQASSPDRNNKKLLESARTKLQHCCCSSAGCWKSSSIWSKWSSWCQGISRDIKLPSVHCPSLSHIKPSLAPAASWLWRCVPHQLEIWVTLLQKAFRPPSHQKESRWKSLKASKGQVNAKLIWNECQINLKWGQPATSQGSAWNKASSTKPQEVSLDRVDGRS